MRRGEKERRKKRGGEEELVEEVATRRISLFGKGQKDDLTAVRRRRKPNQGGWR